jgi:hypothetical protein
MPAIPDFEYNVAIITGWSNIGGSTESFINLTNLLNSKGINTVLIGPNPWHLDKCKAKVLSRDVMQMSFKNVIWHFIPYPKPTKLWSYTNHILSCHETSLNLVFSRYSPQIANNVFDHYHFVSHKQKEFQLNTANVEDSEKMVVIPNVLDPKLSRVYQTHSKKIGGVIGSIDVNKNTHVSIQRALEDGCELVLLYGLISDSQYFDSKIRHILNTNAKIKYMGVETDKTKMYSSITDVYHYSLSESWGYIQAECHKLGIPFHSLITNDLTYSDESDILKRWKEILL